MKRVFCAVGTVLIFFSTLLPTLASESEKSFAKGTRTAGFSGGAAFGTTTWGGAVAHDSVLLNVHYGIFASDLLAEGRFYRGYLVLTGDFTFAQYYQPSSSLLFGVNPLVRYVFEGSERWKPFVDAGVGFALTDIGLPNLAGKLQFSPQFGVGVYWFFKPDVALTCQGRFVHYSNGGMRSPNSGVNQYVSLLGVTRFY